MAGKGTVAAAEHGDDSGFKVAGFDHDQFLGFLHFSSSF
jgi:hypothetical protein